MPDHGVLYDKKDVKLLILYVLKCLDRPVPFESLNNVIMAGGNAFYFDFADSLNALMESGHVVTVSRDGELRYLNSPLGNETITLLEQELPFSARQNAASNTLIELSRLKLESEIKTQVTEAKNGFRVNCKMFDMSDEIFDFTLLVPTKKQADLLVDSFRRDPVRLYQTVLDTLV
ncbi:DUF4364 family protein [Feifania hominis]|uniref:DUF4364 family protein n=1 Tax=Feifania hominis TaxID=2763660 RepID=A0A926DC49_9FIRM|nr:DUF4364 family protein [Feifania hominis]MBC8535501.1 DUF4364 family protein [Feifania hominis]